MRSSNEWDCAGERTYSWDDETPDPDWLKEIERIEERVSTEPPKIEAHKITPQMAEDTECNPIN